MKTKVSVLLTRTYKDEPLVVLIGGPFCDAEFRPARAREIAGLLNRLADMAEARDTTSSKFMNERLEVEL